ncbi:MAG: hypothetical protein ACMXX7_01265 [Candidatus Woesearchaeota archaeon]
MNKLNKKAIAPVMLTTMLFLIGIIILGFILIFIVNNVIEQRETQFDADYLYLSSMHSTRTILTHQINETTKVHELITKRVHENNREKLIEELNEILSEIDDQNRWILQIETNREDFFNIRLPQDNRLNTYLNFILKQTIPNKYGYQISASFSLISNQEYQTILEIRQRDLQTQREELRREFGPI